MRAFIALLALALAAPAALAAPPPRALASGPSAATVTGIRLFPRLVGEPMPGWLQATDGPELAAAYEGYHEERGLPNGARLVTVRSQGLMAAYALEGDRCVGELLVEPTVPDAPAATAAKLRRAGFAGRSGLLATRDRGYGADAVRFERRRHGDVEHYLLVDLPVREGGVVVTRTFVGAEGHWPLRLHAAFAPAIAQGAAALADFCREKERAARNLDPNNPF